jgi:hypothetical protein
MESFVLESSSFLNLFSQTNFIIDSNFNIYCLQSGGRTLIEATDDFESV